MSSQESPTRRLSERSPAPAHRRAGRRCHALVGMWSALAIAAVSGGCARPAALDPHGPGAARSADLWWIMFWLATAIYVGVLGILLYALYRRRGAAARPTAGRRFIIAGGVILPAFVLTILFVLTLRALEPTVAREGALTVQVIGHQWWWEARYPAAGVTTANEIHIPAGRPVRLELASNDVVHNFWVPELLGKFDLIPGETHAVWVQADRAGVYQGLCAEYCGVQHAKMRFAIVADPPDRFAAWVARQREPAAAPTDALLLRGQQTFVGADCGKCHAIGGTSTPSQPGPDLTHLAGRGKLGAGILENNRDNLASWIRDPQAIKPGNKMPPTALSDEDLQALLAYLESLK